MKYYLTFIATVFCSLSLAASDTECDRQCLSGFADQVVRSMLDHNPESLPLAVPYRATENSRAYKLEGLSLWRTVTGIEGQRYDIIDTDAGQVFFIVVINEATGKGILKTRMKVEQDKISELEMYVARDPVDTGEHFNPGGIAEIEDMWWQTVDPKQRAGRELLARVGQASFSTSEQISFQPGCYHYEEGDKVGQMQCKAPPNRPVDANARVAVIDVELGIVVSIADIHGEILSRGVFVPTTMLAEIRAVMSGEIDRDLPPRPETFQPTQETLNVIQLTKVADGKIQGTQAYMNAQGPGARSPWVETE